LAFFSRKGDVEPARLAVFGTHPPTQTMWKGDSVIETVTMT
jgi:hypothetical protein